MSSAASSPINYHKLKATQAEVHLTSG